jgi:hypothetical protein
MKHKLLDYKRQVNKTHNGLGNLFSFSLMATKARKFSIIIAVSGTGKTTALKAAMDCNPEENLMLDAITRSGLKPIQEKLNGFKGTFLLSDLGNIDTGYSLKESVKTLVNLVYEHTLSKMNAQINLSINDFQGSALTTGQPVIMQRIVNSPDWEAVIQDKTLRYYHLYRPLKVNNKPIKINAKWGIDLDDVSIVIPKNKQLKELYKMAMTQFGISRAEQHVNDMLRACAALDGRKKVQTKDFDVLIELTKPMRFEQYIVSREGFESDKEFMHNDMCLLTEAATYHKLDKNQMQINYKITRRTLDRILHQMNTWFLPNLKDADTIEISLQTKEVLEECGYW